MTRPASRDRLHYTIAIVWLVFMVSMASWWLTLGLTMTNRHRMFMWEGGTFLTLLIAGGLVIVLAIRREPRVPRVVPATTLGVLAIDVLPYRPKIRLLRERAHWNRGRRRTASSCAGRSPHPGSASWEDAWIQYVLVCSCVH